MSGKNGKVFLSAAKTTGHLVHHNSHLNFPILNGLKNNKTLTSKQLTKGATHGKKTGKQSSGYHRG